MDTHSENKKIVQLAREANEKKYENRSKDNLKRHLATKLRTTMIGSLDRFEKIFGSVWGHGKDEPDLTPEEIENRKLWELVRTEVLNNGNNQLRAAMSEVDQYTVKYNKQRYDFVVVKPGDKGDSNG